MITFGQFQACFPALCRRQVRIVVTDDSLQGRGGLCAMLEQPPVLTVVAQVADGPALLAACAREAPDVAVVDLCMPLPEDGLALCRELRRHFPRVRVMVVTGHESARARAEARKTEAVHGYALKRYSDGLLWKCVLDVAAGRVAFPSYKGGWLAEELSDAAKLHLLDAPSREVLAALAALLRDTPVNEYGVIKELVLAHAAHPRLGHDKHVRRTLEKVRDLLGMKSLPAARWYAHAQAEALAPPPEALAASPAAGPA